MTEPAVTVAPCGCRFRGRIVESDQCTVIDHKTITGRERNRHTSRVLKSLKTAATCSCPLVEPGGDLEFARKGKGRVHIIRWHDLTSPEHDGVRGTEVTFEHVLALVRRPLLMLCGRTVLVSDAGMWGGNHPYAEYVTEFADIDTCRGCVEALGAESHRAFEHDQVRED